MVTLEKSQLVKEMITQLVVYWIISFSKNMNFDVLLDDLLLMSVKP